MESVTAGVMEQAELYRLSGMGGALMGALDEAVDGGELDEAFAMALTEVFEQVGLRDRRSPGPRALIGLLFPPVGCINRWWARKWRRLSPTRRRARASGCGRCLLPRPHFLSACVLFPPILELDSAA